MKPTDDQDVVIAKLREALAEIKGAADNALDAQVGGIFDAGLNERQALRRVATVARQALR